MRALICLAVLAAAAAAAAAAKVPWNGFYATWSYEGPKAYKEGKAFHPLPNNTKVATDRGWAKAEEGELGDVWCLHNNSHVCLLFDKQGNIGGIQLGFPLDDIKDTPYKWNEHPVFLRDKIYGQEMVLCHFLLVPEDDLKGDGRSSVDEIGTGLWFRNGKNFDDVPQDSTKLEERGWVKENCIDYTDTLYHLNFSKSMDCQDAQPLFLMADSKNNWVTGFGVQIFGRRSDKEKQSPDWYDEHDKDSSKEESSEEEDEPDCIKHWGRKYGMLSIRIFLTQKPYTKTC